MDEKVEIRFLAPVWLKRHVEAAAEAQGESVAAFMRDAARRAATKTLENAERDSVPVGGGTP